MFNWLKQVPKDRIDKLVQLLTEARNLLLSPGIGNRWTDWFDSPKELANEIDRVIEELHGGNLSSIGQLKGWFAPTSAWDDLSSESGTDLGNAICEVLSGFPDKTNA